MENRESREESGNVSDELNADQYHKMVEEVEDYAILMLNSQGIVQNWNRGAGKIKGYREDEIVGKHFRIFYTAQDREAELPEKLINEATHKGRAVHEGWRVRKDGTTFWGSIVITALHNSRGQVIGFSKVTRDLTERKLSEDKLIQYARQLEIRNRELQQFAYAAAHDMKEPLRKIQFYNSAVIGAEIELSAEKQKVYLQRSSDAAGRMQLLIDDLLAFTKVSEGSGLLVDVDLAAIVGDVSTFFQEALQDAEGVVTADKLPVIRGIPFQVRQLFINLFSNSIKYRDQTRPLRIEFGSSLILNPGLGEVDNYLPTRFVKVFIKDNGIGFAPEFNERVFDMFQRLHNRDSYSGTGIGLSICRKIMENNKGYIQAIGHPGEGTVFEMFFPE